MIVAGIGCRKGATPEDKRATLVVQVPRRERPWT